MDISKLAIDLVKQQFGNQLDDGNIMSALSGLLGEKGGNLDLSSLVSSMMQNGGLASLAQSFLGDGANSSMSAVQIMELFGQGKVSNFASQLGVPEQEASAGLADMLPKLLDKSSSGGSLMDLAGGGGGLLGMASKFLK